MNNNFALVELFQGAVQKVKVYSSQKLAEQGYQEYTGIPIGRSEELDFDDKSGTTVVPVELHSEAIDLTKVNFGYHFNGHLEHGQTALLTDLDLCTDEQHIMLTMDDEEAIVTDIGGSVQICRDHWERIGRLMNWI